MLNTPRELCFSVGVVHAGINSILAIYMHLRFVANGVKGFFSTALFIIEIRNSFQ